MQLIDELCGSNFLSHLIDGSLNLQFGGTTLVVFGLPSSAGHDDVVSANILQFLLDLLFLVTEPPDVVLCVANLEGVKSELSD